MQTALVAGVYQMYTLFQLMQSGIGVLMNAGEKLPLAQQQYHMNFNTKTVQTCARGDRASVEQHCSVVQVKQSVAVLYHLPHILTHIQLGESGFRRCVIE